MPDREMVYVVRVGGLTFGDSSPSIGDTIDPREYPGRRYDRLVRTGALDPIQREVSADEVEDEDDGSVPLDQMTREALIAELEDRDLTVEDVEGTGAEGYVRVDDLVRAVEDYDALSEE